MKTTKEWLTISEYAKFHNTDRQKVHARVKAGHIMVNQFGMVHYKTKWVPMLKTGRKRKNKD